LASHSSRSKSRAGKRDRSTRTPSRCNANRLERSDGSTPNE
jgi:hypothetical protein